MKKYKLAKNETKEAKWSVSNLMIIYQTSLDLRRKRRIYMYKPAIHPDRDSLVIIILI